MKDIFPLELINLLVISVTLSMIIMVMLQKFKSLSFISKGYQIWVLNLVFSFSLAIPFTEKFYKLTYLDGLWVGLFTFVGAPSIYETLKKQNIIKYKPSSIDDSVSIPKENEIKRK